MKIIAKLLQTITMTSEEDTNVKDLLNTLLVPTYPPNRSQWKKLELALKFINMSKQSAKETRTEAAKAKRNTKTMSHSTEKEPVAKKPRMVIIEPCKSMAVAKNDCKWTKIKDSFQHML